MDIRIQSLCDQVLVPRPQYGTLVVGAACNACDVLFPLDGIAGIGLGLLHNVQVAE